MDTILLTVTGISLALAAIMGVLLARMLREERRRSDARVALLSEMAAEPSQVPSYAEIEVEPARSQRVSSPPRREPQRVTIQAPREPQRVIIQPERELATRPSRTLGFDDFELRPSTDEVPGVHDLFHEQEEPSPWPRRFAVVGGLAAVIALVVFGWSNLPLGRGRRTSRVRADRGGCGRCAPRTTVAQARTGGGRVDDHRTRAESARGQGTVRRQGHGLPVRPHRVVHHQRPCTDRFHCPRSRGRIPLPDPGSGYRQRHSLPRRVPRGGRSRAGTRRSANA